jgi:predicted lipoprotein with Yx(FWY)xxD motif
MRPTSRLISLAGVATAALLFAAACSSAATPTAAAPGAADTSSTAPMATQAAGGLTLGVTNDPTLGAYFTGQNGMTLYHLTDDTSDTSTCTGTCATHWPPLTAASGTTITGPTGATGTFAQIARPDGTMQVAYNHQPLYYYSGDSKAGDTTGQGLLGKWFVAPLTATGGAAATPAVTPAAASPTSATGY